MGLRRHRRLGLHRRRDDRHRPSADRRPGRGGAAGARRRRRLGAAADRRLRGPARGGARRRPGRRRPARRDRRPGAADEVPARAVRPPYVAVPDAATLEALAADEDARRPGARRALAGPRQERRACCRSPTSRRRVAVIGPIADSARDLLGDYSHLVHMETLREMHEGVDALGIVGEGEVIAAGRRAHRAADDPRCAPLGARRRPTSVHARGTGISAGTDEELAAAVEARPRCRRRDPRPRRALRPDRRLDDRRVPRPFRTRASWAASRSCSRPWSRPARRSCSWS